MQDHQDFESALGVSAPVPAAIAAYMRDVADHHAQARERILAFDKMVGSILSASIARLSVQQNTDMRKISAGAALVAVPSRRAQRGLGQVGSEAGSG